MLSRSARYLLINVKNLWLAGRGDPQAHVLVSERVLTGLEQSILEYFHAI